MGSEKARAILEDAVARVHADAIDRVPGGHWNRASIARCGESFRVAYFGGPWDEGVLVLFRALARPDVAPWIASIELAADDVGANGTCDWNLGAHLAREGVAFPRLSAFRVERGDPHRHNRIVIGELTDTADAGILGRIADGAPALASLESPSAPDASFLARVRPALRLLHVNAGYDHARFVRDLATRGAAALPALEVLAWGDCAETYLDDWRAQTTPREDYVALFDSEIFRRIRLFTWRSPPFDDAEIDALLASAPHRSIAIERGEKRYVRRR